MVVLTCNTLFPLLILLPNLQSHLYWMEVDLTIVASPTNPTTLATSMPSNSEWEAVVVITSAQLSQNLVLNFEQVHLQGSFQ